MQQTSKQNDTDSHTTILKKLKSHFTIQQFRKQLISSHSKQTSSCSNIICSRRSRCSRYNFLMRRICKGYREFIYGLSHGFMLSYYKFRFSLFTQPKHVCFQASKHNTYMNE